MNHLRQHADEQLRHVVWRAEDTRAVLGALKGEKVVKKKLSVGLVLAVMCVMLTVGALATAMIGRSGRDDAVLYARAALMETYGFTGETMALFSQVTASLVDNGWEVSFTNEALPLGVYTVQVTGEDCRVTREGAWGQEEMLTHLGMQAATATPMATVTPVPYFRARPTPTAAQEEVLPFATVPIRTTVTPVPEEAPAQYFRTPPPAATMPQEMVLNGVRYTESEPVEGELTFEQARAFLCREAANGDSPCAGDLRRGSWQAGRLYRNASGEAVWELSASIEGFTFGGIVDAETGKVLYLYMNPEEK